MTRTRFSRLFPPLRLPGATALRTWGTRRSFWYRGCYARTGLLYPRGRSGTGATVPVLRLRSIVLRPGTGATRPILGYSSRAAVFTDRPCGTGATPSQRHSIRDPPPEPQRPQHTLPPLTQSPQGVALWQPLAAVDRAERAPAPVKFTALDKDNKALIIRP